LAVLGALAVIRSRQSHSPRQLHTRSSITTPPPSPSLRTWGSGTRVGSSEVEIRFSPKAWAWPEHSQTRKWASRQVSGRVETEVYPAVSTLGDIRCTRKGASVISIYPTTRSRVYNRQVGGAADLVRFVEAWQRLRHNWLRFSHERFVTRRPRFMLPSHRQSALEPHLTARSRDQHRLLFLVCPACGGIPCACTIPLRSRAPPATTAYSSKGMALVSWRPCPRANLLVVLISRLATARFLSQSKPTKQSPRLLW
jgi:hypothetical protein